MDDYIRGIFIEELKNRFLCLVRIEDQEEVCYVPSSCHLSNFLDLNGKEVLLTLNKSKGTRTRFSLFAIPYKRSYMVLNTSMANSAVAKSIKSRSFSFLGKRRQVEKEYRYGGYKCDFFIRDTNTIIEIKSVISTQDVARFPTVYSERGIRQLQQLQTFLRNDMHAAYCIISLNPYVKQIQLDRETEWFCELEKCIDFGLRLKAYALRLSSKYLKIDKEIDVLH